MAKKKSKSQAFVLKPWCWYCEREFEDEKVLLQHQKSKHFKCQMCPRKLNTAGGLMVHSQQVHKCDPEPLTNTLPGRDGYDIEIFGMEGVPTNALAEWKARKESEAGVAAMSSTAGGKNRPRNTYNVIPEADLHVALIQHKALMAARDQQPGGQRGGMPPPMPGFPPNGMPPPFPGFPPPGMAGMPPGMGMPPPTLPPGGPPPGFQPPPGFRPPFPFPPPGTSPLPPPGSASPATPIHPPTFVPQSGFPPQPPQPQFGTPTPAPPAAVNGSSTAAVVPKDGVLWPDSDSTPAEKRAQDPRYRYTSPGVDGDDGSNTKKRKAAEDFL